MSHFYGTLEGNRGQATRCGTKNSGIRTNAAGWGGSIEASVYEEDGVDRYQVWLTPWQGSGGDSKLLSEGELNSRAAVKSNGVDWESIVRQHEDFVTASTDGVCMKDGCGSCDMYGPDAWEQAAKFLGFKVAS